jgi:hypothetical protein
LSLIHFVSDEEGEEDAVHLGESMWPIRVIEVAATVGGVVIEGVGGASNASGIVGIAAIADAGGSVSVVKVSDLKVRLARVDFGGEYLNTQGSVPLV